MDEVRGIGDNNPPDPLVLEADERIDTAEKWLTERAEIADADMADKAAFFVTQINATFKALDDQRKDENRKWDAAQSKKYSDPLSLLTKAKEKLVAMRTAWLKREQTRVAAEKAKVEAEAKRVADEAAAAAARAEKKPDNLRAQLEAEKAAKSAQEAADLAAAAPTKAIIKGNYTKVAVGLRTFWSATITDRALAFKTYKTNAIVLAAIDEAMVRVASAQAKLDKDASKAPPGVKFISEER